MVSKMDTTNKKTAPGANRAALNTDFDKSDRASANNQAQSTNDLRAGPVCLDRFSAEISGALR